MKAFVFSILAILILNSCKQKKTVDNEIKATPTINIPNKHLDTFTHQNLSEESNEYLIHLKEIDTSINYPDLFLENKDTAWIKRISYKQFLKRYILQKPSDLKYVTCIKLLPKLKRISCDLLKTKIEGKLKTGELVEINLKIKKFAPKHHRILYERTEEGTISYTKSIDGEIPWGGEYGLPDYEIESFTISVNKKEVFIPKSAYQNFYDFNVCQDWGAFSRKFEAYTSIDSKFIYIYLEGGNAAGRYLAKLVFDKDKYLTRMIADHIDQAYASAFGQYPVMNF